MRRRLFSLFILICITWISACVPAAGTSTTVGLPPTQVYTATVVSTSTIAVSTTALPSPTFIASATPAPSHTPSPEIGGIQIYYAGYAQFELSSPDGLRVLVDVYDPQALSQPPTDQDILLTTHDHWDHYNQSFVESFAGAKLDRRVGEIELPGVRVTGIASAHNAGERLKPEGGTNYIYLIEMGGLRIAHFGDIGQEQLTAEQLAALGTVDIAISQLNNPYSDMSLQNLKGFKLLEQVQPKLLIPTHLNRETLEYALQQWSGFYAEVPLWIEPGQLSGETQLLLLGENALTYRDIFGLQPWGSP